jgi:hypothetical protein
MVDFNLRNEAHCIIYNMKMIERQTIILNDGADKQSDTYLPLVACPHQVLFMM